MTQISHHAYAVPPDPHGAPDGRPMCLLCSPQHRRRPVFPPERDKPMTGSHDSNTDPELLTIQLPLWKWQEYVTGHESNQPRQATV